MSLPSPRNFPAASPIEGVRGVGTGDALGTAAWTDGSKESMRSLPGMIMTWPEARRTAISQG